MRVECFEIGVKELRIRVRVWAVVSSERGL